MQTNALQCAGATGRAFTFVMMLAGAGGLVACGGSTAAPEPAGTVTVTLAAVRDSLFPGDSVQLQGAIVASGTVPAGTVGTYASQAPSIATVSATGVVVGRAAGNATIVFSAGSATAQTVVTVRDGGRVTPSGGTVATSDSAAALTFPAGALSSATPISVVPVADSVGGDQRFGATFTFGPAGTQFAQPVTMALKYDRASLSSGIPASALRVSLLNSAGQWEPVTEGAAVDSATGTVRALVRHFSTYGITRDPCSAPTFRTGFALVGALDATDCRRNDLFGRLRERYKLNLVPDARGMVAVGAQTAFPADLLFTAPGTVDTLGRFLASVRLAAGTVAGIGATPPSRLVLVTNGTSDLELALRGADSTARGAYVFSQVIAPTTYACPTGGAAPLIYMLGNTTVRDAHGDANTCRKAIAVSPNPAFIGQPINTQDYRVPIVVGRTYTFTLTPTSGTLPPQLALTVFGGDGSFIGQQVGSTNNGASMTVSFVCERPGFAIAEIASGGPETFAPDSPWIIPSFSHQLAVTETGPN